MALGYDGPLFILAFDHRGARHLPMFGVDGDQAADQRRRISAVKHIVHDGFEMARETAGLGQEAGILVDEEFGADIARRASADGVTVAMPVEVSGLDHFAFEYGEQFGAHLDDFDPTFAKVLVRFNPEGDTTKNELSLGRLRMLSDWLRPRTTKLLLELVVPAEPHQLDATGGVDAYDRTVRAGLMRTAMALMQSANIEADLWKIEGLDRREDCEMIAEQARAADRDQVGCVVLSRGAEPDTVERWLRVGAEVPGFVGFAIGRTVWRSEIAGYLDDSLTAAAAAARIATNYRRCIDFYTA